MFFRVTLVLISLFAFYQKAYSAPVPLQKPIRIQPKAYPEAAMCKASLDLASEKKWSEALQQPSLKSCPVASKLIRWLQLRQGAENITFQEYAQFISQNTYWPWIHKLRRQAEGHITADTQPAHLIAFFKSFPPLTTQGALAYVNALIKTGQTKQAIVVVRKTWGSHPLTPQEQKQFIKDYDQHLRLTDHIARAKHMLTQERVDQVKRVLPLLPTQEKQTAKVRLAFIAKDPNAEAQAQQLPPDSQKDPDLLYNWIKWHRKQDNLAGAHMLLTNVSPESTKTSAWWTEQMGFAREALTQNNPKLAYQMLEQHPWKTGRQFSEAEWFLGWVALTYLNEPEKAYDHFRRMARDAQTAISRSQAYYWMGRVAEAGKQPERANNWYQKSAQYSTTFYGQRSIEKLGQCRSVSLNKPKPAKTQEHFDASLQELSTAVKLLKQIQSGEDILSFVYLINKRADSSGKRTQAMHLIREVWPEYLVESLKIHGITNAWSYPLVKHWVDHNKKDAAFILAIMRQESNFNRFTRSPKDALGLIQLIPGTAKLMAKKLKMPYERRRLTEDPAYNLKLGTEYISDRLKEFEGSLILTAASYNAGPTPVYKWLKRNGDPRLKGTDLIQWIEKISYGQTRDYIKYVLSNYQIYRQLLTKKCETFPRQMAS